MNENKTVCSCNDGTNVILSRFVAGNKDDLCSGTIHATKVTQKYGESFDLEKIELGSSRSTEFKMC